MSTFFLMPIFFISFFSLLDGFHFIKNSQLQQLFNEYLQHVFEHTKNNYRMPSPTIFQRGTSSARLIFNSMFGVVVLQCVQFFLKCFFPNPSLLSFSFPLLKLFSFYFLSSILLGISKCLISQNIVQVCLIKTPLKRKQHSHNVSRGQPMSSIDLQQYVCCGGPLLCPVFFEAIFFQNPLLLSLAIAFVSYLVQFSWHPLLDFYGVSIGFL